MMTNPHVPRGLLCIRALKAFHNLIPWTAGWVWTLRVLLQVGKLGPTAAGRSYSWDSNLVWLVPCPQLPCVHTCKELMLLISQDEYPTELDRRCSGKQRGGEVECELGQDTCVWTEARRLPRACLESILWHRWA